MRTLAAVLLLLLAPSAWAQSAPGQVAPVVKPQDVRKIAKHVHIISDNDVPLVTNPSAGI